MYKHWCNTFFFAFRFTMIKFKANYTQYFLTNEQTKWSKQRNTYNASLHACDITAPHSTPWSTRIGDTWWETQFIAAVSDKTKIPMEQYWMMLKCSVWVRRARTFGSLTHSTCMPQLDVASKCALYILYLYVSALNLVLFWSLASNTQNKIIETQNMETLKTIKVSDKRRNSFENSFQAIFYICTITLATHSNKS